RFVDPDEKARADELTADPRTNDQLAYDLFFDLMRAGALADATSVFGARQPGVRVVVTELSLDAAAAGEPAVALVEDDQTSLPGWTAAQQICETGTVRCTLDPDGNPLDLGREARLYSSKQRVALAVRDGGCRWRGCDRPAPYCEAHHIDAYAAGGRTDIDRGILLCRWHHMELHHGGWRITREGRGDFILHAPPGRGDPTPLVPRLALRQAWADVGRPADRARSQQQQARHPHSASPRDAPHPRAGEIHPPPLANRPDRLSASHRRRSAHRWCR
ncbi:MAG TPA: HNH endonuclease signature motif containing protein, partial [Agromyces sp.]